MKDSDAIIVKAFLAALAQLSEPLPAPLQQQLQTISETERFTQLVLLARGYEPLKLAYQQANTQFIEQGNQHRKGLEFLPDSNLEEQNFDNSELDNASSDVSGLNSLPQIIAKIEQKWSTQEVSQILESPDPVEAVQTWISFYPV
ncbi:hypothetical protein NG791_26865 [Laspinema sp. D1]|uniref:hypothetical protein n=1 Tax=Laspinema palackyanum TaxID=3231601 RepID=UPI0034868EE4|nr:hypothetical protein [Laspinema sp. D2b]